jgi:hypothetical protein
MKNYLDETIAVLEGRVQELTSVLEKLRWFRREFPHAAAAVTPATRRHRKGTRRMKRTSYSLQGDSLDSRGKFLPK